MKVLKPILWAIPLVIALAQYYTTKSTGAIYNVLTIGAGLALLFIGYIQSQSCRICAPEISTFSDYAQKFKIINHGNKPIKYTFKFLSDVGVEVKPLSKSTGVVGGHQSIYLHVYELLELVGTSRASALISFNAAPSKVTVTLMTKDLTNKNFISSELSAK